MYWAFSGYRVSTFAHSLFQFLYRSQRMVVFGLGWQIANTDVEYATWSFFFVLRITVNLRRGAGSTTLNNPTRLPNRELTQNLRFGDAVKQQMELVNVGRK